MARPIGIDLKGKRFGRLIAIKPNGHKGKDIGWLCKCSCGKSITTRRTSLLNKSTRSCGCLQQEYLASRVINPKHTVSCTICGKIFTHRLSRDPLTCSSKDCKLQLGNNRRRQHRKGPNPSFSHRISMIVSAAKTRATQKEIPFNITSKWVVDQCHKQDMKCKCTGIPFHLESSSLRTPWTPSLDQIIPGKGYTKDNVQVVCQMYNLAKYIWKHDDVITMSRSLLIKEKHNV